MAQRVWSGRREALLLEYGVGSCVISGNGDDVCWWNCFGAVGCWNAMPPPSAPPQYVSSEMGSSTCPNGYTPLTTNTTDCESARTAINNGATDCLHHSTTQWSPGAVPEGCFYYLEAQFGPSNGCWHFADFQGQADQPPYSSDVFYRVCSLSQ